MAQAYMSSSGKEKNHALGNVKAGYKECTQAMCTLEAQLEQMMGSLEMRMKGTVIDKINGRSTNKLDKMILPSGAHLPSYRLGARGT